MNIFNLRRLARRRRLLLIRWSWTSWCMLPKLYLRFGHRAELPLWPNSLVELDLIGYTPRTPKTPLMSVRGVHRGY